MTAQTSKAIKTELKKVFPKVKFSVKTPHYGRVDVRWIDGPMRKEVQNIVGKYEMGYFDGMNDIYEYNNHRDDIPQCKYVFTTRDYSDTLIAWGINKTQESYNIHGKYTVEDYKNGSLLNVYVVSNSTDPHWSFSSAINRTIEEIE
jgi:hypothetical protein